MTTEKNWAETGVEAMKERNISHKRIEAAIEALKWQELVPNEPLSLPAGPGLAVKAAIKEFRIPRVSHVAISNELAPYGFYGIRGHYLNGDADVFILDMGTHLATLRSDFTPQGCGKVLRGTNGRAVNCGAFLTVAGQSNREFCEECAVKH